MEVGAVEWLEGTSEEPAAGTDEVPGATSEGVGAGTGLLGGTSTLVPGAPVG